MAQGENARFLYFAYGSNMFTRRLTARTPSAIAVGIGYIAGHRLTFDKVSKDGSGKCDAEATGRAGDRTHGVLFEISSSEKPQLDRFEGLNQGYREEKVRVVTSAGGAREAVTYVATSKDPALFPYDWYKALVIAGAVEHGLPDPYIEWLRTFHSQADPDAKRRAENKALLFAS